VGEKVHESIGENGKTRLWVRIVPKSVGKNGKTRLWERMVHESVGENRTKHFK